MNEPLFGGDNPGERPPFGITWTTRHEWRDNPGHGGTDHFRDQFERLAESDVNWTPYLSVLHLLPGRVMVDRHIWFARISVIFFWIVEMHYPDRVMRQFGLYQRVPPPTPLDWIVVDGLRGISHTTHDTNTDWAETHRRY